MAAVDNTSNVPDGDHFALLRNAPGGGVTYEVFTDRVAWQAAIAEAHNVDATVKGIMVQTAKVTVEVKLDRPVV